MQQVKKVVLAYSGGVDTSVCIPYLKNEYGISEVVTFVADLGQGEDLELIRQKALNSGASKSIVGNLVDSFVEKYAFPAIRANALYLDKYPLSTALARPLIAENLVNIAREINADAVAHGCTGKGNDQVRFDLAINALGPDLRIITPAREWNMSREDAILYGEKFGIPAPVSKKSPYSIDVNLLGRSIEAGILEDPMQEAPEDIFAITSSIDKSPDSSQDIEIVFKNGFPIGINDEPRKDSHLVYVNQADGLKGVLNRDFDEWSNFDSWESISVQQWIFSRALEVFRGKKIDIKCDCCENNNLIPNDFESIKKEKCFGKKSAYMIEKVVDEIVLAKARRESDGTYSA